jgi:hypothetical protein
MPFRHSGIWVLAAAPLGVLMAVALLGDVPGEWGRAAVLAYASVLLGLLTGIGAGGAALPVPAGSVLAVGGLFMGFAALSLGGTPGHALLGMSYAALTVLAWLRPNIGVPWPLALIGGIACLITLVRTALG